VISKINLLTGHTIQGKIKYLAHSNKCNRNNHNHLVYNNNRIMKENSKNIEIGKGFGSILFGMSRDEVKKITGDPDEIENYQHGDVNGEKAEAWHFDDPEISLAFEEFNDWKLTSIAVSSPDFLFEGKSIMGLGKEEILQTLKKLDLGKIEQEDCSSDESPDLFLVSIEDAGLNLWFDENVLTEIQWSVIWDDEDDEE
jgi:hypothetical protein